MQHDSSNVAMYAVVLCLPLLVWVVSRPVVWQRVRPRLAPYAKRVWAALLEREGPDDLVLQRWALIRLDQLRHDLERVRRLLADDAWMTATRQTGNRLAYEHLLHDVREAEATAAAYGPVEDSAAVAAPTPRPLPRLTFAPVETRTNVEVLELGPTGRWF